MTTYGAALAEGRAALSTIGVGGAARDARLLLAAAAGLDMAALIARSGDTLPTVAQSTFSSYLMRRTRGEPVARILGEAEFWGLKFKLNAATLVPRPDTETLVEAVLEAARRRSRPDIAICDLGTGSGVIAIALLSELCEARGAATDISDDALRMARFNAERHGVTSRLTLQKVSFADGPDGPFDVVVANPPYIRSDALPGLQPEVRDHGPCAALDGGPDGLDAYRAILGRAGKLLADGGFLAFEVGHDQGEAVGALCWNAGLSGTRIHADLGGRDRVVTASCKVSGVIPRVAKKALGKVG